MKKALRIIGFVLLLAAVLAVTYNVYKLKDTNAHAESAIMQLEKMDKDLIDVFFVGSSHVYCGVQPGTIFRSKGIASFDLSISGMDRESAYYFTKYETATYKPKVVVVDVYGLTFEGYSDAPSLIGNKYRNLLQLPYTKEAYDLLKRSLKEDEIPDYLLRWPIIHSRYRELSEADFRDTYKFEFTMGEELSSTMSDYLDLTPSLETDSVTPLSDTNIEWTERFVALSKERGFEVVFVRIPYQSSEQDQSILNGFSEYAKEKGYTYIDMLDYYDELNLAMSDFNDPMHLNMYGGKKASKWLAGFLSDRYNLADHRNDERYEAWEKDAQYTYMSEEIISLKNSYVIDSPYIYLSNIQGYDSIANIVVLRGSLDDCYGPVEEYINCFDIDFSEYIEGGVWLITNNGVVRLASQNESDTVYYDLDSHNTLRVGTDDDKDFIKMNNESVSTLENGLTVITYDMFGQEIILNKQYN